jgi:SAM-dependent MidA family methyltransferase
LPFDQVLELALYHEELGFYAAGSGAGRGGDFLTSPELGPLFGAVLARALDRWWDELGRPDPYVVVEAGAGSGALAAAVVQARPGCGPALRYVLVERSPAWRRHQARRLPLEPAGLVLGPTVETDPDSGPQTIRGLGPLMTSLGEMPAGSFAGVVLANELLDNLPFRLLERTGEGWSEVRVSVELTELLVPAGAELEREAEGLAPQAEPGARIPLQRQAASWLRATLGTLTAGRVVAFDYADTTPSLARRPWREWIRTYRGHGRGGHPLEHLGQQDVTCEVAVDQLAEVRPPRGNRSQSEFLGVHGLDELVEDARRRWQDRAAIGDLEAVAARSRISEAAALTDPTGLGAFRALEWRVP